jgi:hypothetical protein
MGMPGWTRLFPTTPAIAELGLSLSLFHLGRVLARTRPSTTPWGGSMPGFTWPFSGFSLHRLGRWLRQLRSALAALRPTVRWTLAAATLLALAVLALVTTRSLSLSSTQSLYLHSGRRFQPGDLAKITRVLDRLRIDYRVDDQRRIAIASEQIEQATAGISKLDLGPRLPGEIRDDPSSAAGSWLDTPHDKELREHRRQEQILQSMISDLAGIIDAFVLINRPKPRGLEPAPKPSAFVRIETEGDRQIPFRTVQSITTYLTGYVPGLSADAITVVDRRGHNYLDAGNPALSELSHNRAREEELREVILEKLDWIEGVRVSVQLPGSAESGPGTKPESSSRDQAAVRPELEPLAAAPEVRINRPMTLEREPTIKGPSAPVKTPGGSGGQRDVPAEPGRVWVKIPRSYFLRVSQRPGRKEPPYDELQKLIALTEEQIKTGIALVLSGPTVWETKIDVIRDVVPLEEPTLAAPQSVRRVEPDWALAWGVGVGVGTIILLAMGSWILSSRRPAMRQRPAPRTLRFHHAAPVSPGPSERVREFVRRNPESAVSVLERWTSHGENAL